MASERRGGDGLSYRPGGGKDPPSGALPAIKIPMLWQVGSGHERVFNVVLQTVFESWVFKDFNSGEQDIKDVPTPLLAVKGLLRL